MTMATKRTRVMATKRTRTASHRPAVRQRQFRHDTLTAVELFGGYGGMTQGIERAGIDVIMAANHNAYKVEIHEANHPTAEHWIADLANPDSGDYHDVRDLPPGDLLTAGVSCVNHSPANTMKAYATGGTLFEVEDPDYDERVTRSERDRATANCVLHYAAVHHPRMILVECTTQLQSWGNLVPGSRKVGDGSTHRWWLKQFENLGYRFKILYLNSMFFGVGQSRDRGYWVFWDKSLPAPDLEHRPLTWCGKCSNVTEARQVWKTGIPPTGTVCYGKQYEYQCRSCRRAAIPQFTPSLDALDLSNLGTRIGDKPIRKFKDGTSGPMAATTMARAERCRQRFAEFPAVLMPAKATRGTERHPWQPMSTQTSQQETAILSTGALMAAAGNTFERVGSDCRTRDLSQPLPAQTATNGMGLIVPPVALAVDNFQGAARGAGEPLPTQGGSETMALLSSGVVPFRKNTVPTMHAEAMPTVTAEQIPGLMFSGWYKQNGSTGTETAAHPVTDPLGALTSRDTTALLTAEWHAALAELALEDCYFRMMAPHEIGRGCGFDVTFGNHQGTYIVWGSARDQVDGYGNAVTPAVGEWIGARMRAVLHSEEVAA
ncbi:DNA cytosine methyltransferase [Streptomyces sp. SID13031]|uniref:DNA cytosine methyltransferase n=1 Tax=Streptomyces sp. SID13031 TaxID=2706046 RepID=UPI0013CBDA88|nr:DNA cytosine methyltransferase [Streptomyces sp. SID13031]NEA33101.1 DNA cytosine methyltransferase [Streptomyces sp. SID13031]